MTSIDDMISLDEAKEFMRIKNNIYKLLEPVCGWADTIGLITLAGEMLSVEIYSEIYGCSRTVSFDLSTKST